MSPAHHRHGHDRSEIENGPVLALETARRLACDGHLVGIVEDADGHPLDIGRRTRAIPPAMSRALKARDGGCRFPGCDRTRFTEGHHIEHWSKGGETKLSNLVTLCHFHHRLLHEGGFGLRVTDDGVFVFTRPDGIRVDEHGRPDRAALLARRRDASATDLESRGREKCFRGNTLTDLNAARGVTVSRPPGWNGDRMEYWWVIEAMLWEQRVGMA